MSHVLLKIVFYHLYKHYVFLFYKNILYNSHLMHIFLTLVLFMHLFPISIGCTPQLAIEVALSTK